MYYSPRRHTKKRSPLRAILLGALFLFAFSGALFYLYAKTNLLRVTQAYVISSDPYQEEVQALVNARLPFFIFSVDEVMEDVLSRFLHLRQINTTSDVITNTVIISYTLRQPRFLWCKKEPARACFFVDTDGVIFRTSSLTANSVFTTVEDAYFQGLAVGKRIPLSYASALRAIEDFFEEQELSLIKILINQPFSVYVLIEPDIEVRFTIQKPLEKQLEKLSLFLSSRPKEELIKLTYIDLRIEDSVYYR